MLERRREDAPPAIPPDAAPDIDSARAPIAGQARYPRVRPCSPESAADPRPRVWIQGGRFHKRTSEAAEAGRRQDLRGEFDLLMRCQGVRGIPRVLDFVDDGHLQTLVLERLPHPPLCRLEISWTRLIVVLARLARVVWQIARRGVSHDDLRPENVLVSPRGEVHLVDFDQASSGSLAGCLARSFLGLPVGGLPVANSIAAPVRERLQAALPPRLIQLYGDLRHRRRARAVPAMPTLAPDAGPGLKALHEAWQIGARSHASAPGVPGAYHELVLEGVRFPGERPWSERWRQLRKITDFRGLRILEVGCNMALLSTFLLKDEGAEAALVVDGDPLILDAAAKVACAFGVRPELRRVDLDRDGDWETELEAFRPDVVFCLSVLHWVRDQERLLAFLGRFERVIFEGHASANLERRRLRRAGFAKIDLVATSERGRAVLDARKRLQDGDDGGEDTIARPGPDRKCSRDL